MNWNEMIYGLGDFFWWAFGGLEALGNPFNYFLMTIGTGIIIALILQLIKYAKENKNTPAAE